MVGTNVTLFIFNIFTLLCSTVSMHFDAGSFYEGNVCLVVLFIVIRRTKIAKEVEGMQAQRGYKKRKRQTCRVHVQAPKDR